METWWQSGFEGDVLAALGGDLLVRVGTREIKGNVLVSLRQAAGAAEPVGREVIARYAFSLPELGIHDIHAATRGGLRVGEEGLEGLEEAILAITTRGPGEDAVSQVLSASSELVGRAYEALTGDSPASLSSEIVPVSAASSDGLDASQPHQPALLRIVALNRDVLERPLEAVQPAWPAGGENEGASTPTEPSHEAGEAEQAADLGVPGHEAAASQELDGHHDAHEPPVTRLETAPAADVPISENGSSERHDGSNRDEASDQGTAAQDVAELESAHDARSKPVEPPPGANVSSADATAQIPSQVARAGASASGAPVVVAFGAVPDQLHADLFELGELMEEFGGTHLVARRADQKRFESLRKRVVSTLRASQEEVLAMLAEAGMVECLFQDGEGRRLRLRADGIDIEDAGGGRLVVACRGGKQAVIETSTPPPSFEGADAGGKVVATRARAGASAGQAAGGRGGASQSGKSARGAGGGATPKTSQKAKPASMTRRRPERSH